LKKKVITCFLIILILSGFVSAGSAEDKSKKTSIVEVGNDVMIKKNMKVRNAVAIGGQVTVLGTVERHVVAIGGSVVLTKASFVGGNVVSIGGVIVRGRGAEVQGRLFELNLSDISAAISETLNEGWNGWSSIFAIISLSIFLAVSIIALLITHLFPGPVHIVSAAIKENTWRVTMGGIFALVLIAPLALLLTLSVVGIILIPLEMVIVTSAALFGFIAVARLFGEKILKILKKTERSMVQETLLGLIFLWLIGWIPFVGSMVKAIAIVLGMGGVLITRFGTVTGRSPSPIP